MTTKKHDDDEPDAKVEAEAEAASVPKAEMPAPSPFPYTASINEPQTVSLPLPEGVAVPKPVITLLEPAECMVGDPDFTLYVSGEHFYADSVIHFAGHDEPTTLVAGDRLTTGVKPSLWTDPVTVQVIIKNGPEVSDPVDFEFLPIARASTRKK